MISINLMGGIGNMMFQIAAVESFGREGGFDVGYGNVEKMMTELTSASSWSTHAMEYFDIFNGFKWPSGGDDYSRVVRVPFEYTRVIPEDNTRYVGYFQSSGYIQDREFILRLFEPSDMVKDRMEPYQDIIAGQSCSIHVRRNNYLSLKYIYEVLDMDYYNGAIEYMEGIDIKKFIVFSDDMEWCKKNFRGDKFIFIEDTDYVEMFLMSRCAHNIIANSSFSWWGAWLGDARARRVIAPIKWFSNKIPSDSIVPWNWIKK